MNYVDYKVKRSIKNSMEFNKSVRHDHLISDGLSERAKEIFRTPAYGGRFNAKKEGKSDE